MTYRTAKMFGNTSTNSNIQSLTEFPNTILKFMSSPSPVTTQFHFNQNVTTTFSSQSRLYIFNGILTLCSKHSSQPGQQEYQPEPHAVCPSGSLWVCDGEDPGNREQCATNQLQMQCNGYQCHSPLQNVYLNLVINLVFAEAISK